MKLLSFSTRLTAVAAAPSAVAAAVPSAVAAAAVVAVAAFVVVEAAETDAASEDEFGVVETAVQLKGCAWHDCWDRIAAPLQKRQSSA